MHAYIQRVHANSKYMKCTPQKTHKSQPPSQVRSKAMVNVTVLYNIYLGNIMMGICFLHLFAIIERFCEGCPIPIAIL